MALWLPHSGDQRIVTNVGIVGATPYGTSVTAGASNVYGTVTELISSGNNNQDSWGIFISIMSTSSPGALATQACCDILIGGATDDVLISSLICGGAMRAPGSNYFFPLHIPQGKRIAAQISCFTASRIYGVAVWLYGGGMIPFRTGRKVITYGTKVTNSRGQAITVTASAGAASVTELTSSTTEDHFAVLPGFQTETDTAWATEQFNIGIGIGASTEERLGTWLHSQSSTEESFGPAPPLPAYRSIPSGSRLTMLASQTGSNELAYGGLIYAVS